MKHETVQQASKGSYRVARQVKLDKPVKEKGRCWTCGSFDHVSTTCPRKFKQRSDTAKQKSRRADNVPDHLQQVWEEPKRELQPEQHRELATLLATYGNVFAKSSEDYERTDLTKHKINTGESRPMKQASHRRPLA
ncbi:K02A2.6-like [Cordylochernes scorpioides]|uniref:K02A2.6-like n=1 Tax=Cordylochernes scorpioides TaxID=51811 RepID=A0ABY6KW54_9ARAC|nr:K02A2.6-like [Cordylochernes scorpioides]